MPDCSFKNLITARDPLDSLAWALEKELPDTHAAEVWASLLNTQSEGILYHTLSLPGLFVQVYETGRAI